MPEMDFEADFRRQLIESRCELTISFAREGLEELQFFVATLEDFIAREESREIAALVGHAERVGIDPSGDFWAENHPYWWEQIFASRLRSSYVIALMSAVEQHLRAVSRDATIILNLDDQGAGDSRDPITRARKLLIHEAGFTLPGPPTWDSVRYLYDVRNAFVHNGGMLGDGKHRKRVLQLVRLTPGLNVESGGFVELKPEFIRFAHEKVAQLFRGLATELVRLCGRAATSPSAHL